MTKVKFNDIQIDSTFDYGNATTVDYQGLAFTDTDLSNHFSSVSNQIVSISNMSGNVINCYGTFQNCYNLTSVDKVPASAVNMSYAFRNCYNLATTPSMSNCTNVTDMSYAFYYCNNITEAPDLTNCANLTNMYRCFAYDYALQETPTIPDSVTNVCNTFQGCTNLTEFPVIPNTTNLYKIDYMFDQCRNVTSVGYNIPSTITSMDHTFYRCEGLKGNIFIESNQVTMATDCFANTTASKNVYIPYNYSNGAESATHAAFISAGYDEAGTKHGVTLKDITTYVPPTKYDFKDVEGTAGTFAWTKDLSTATSADAGSVTNVTCDGITYGANCSLGTSSMDDRLTIAHTSHKEAAPGDESYVGFLFNVTKGMFKPKVLSFNVSKNGTSGGSVMVTMKFDSSEEVTIATLPTIARNSEDPSYTDMTIDLTQFDMGASQGTAMIKFYLYNQDSTKTFSLFNISLQGLLKDFANQANYDIEGTPNIDENHVLTVGLDGSSYALTSELDYSVPFKIQIPIKFLRWPNNPSNVYKCVNQYSLDCWTGTSVQDADIGYAVFACIGNAIDAAYVDLGIVPIVDKDLIIQVEWDGSVYTYTLIQENEDDTQEVLGTKTLESSNAIVNSQMRLGINTYGNSNCDGTIICDLKKFKFISSDSSKSYKAVI